MVASDGGRIADVRWDGPAFKAGVAPGGTLVAVNGREYKPERLAATNDAKASNAPIELLVKNGDLYRTFKIDYRDGLRYPHLERIADRPELLDAKVLAPKS